MRIQTLYTFIGIRKNNSLLMENLLEKILRLDFLNMISNKLIIDPKISTK